MYSSAINLVCLQTAGTLETQISASMYRRTFPRSWVFLFCGTKSSANTLTLALPSLHFFCSPRSQHAASHCQRQPVEPTTMLCSLHRIGWSFTNPTNLRTTPRTLNLAPPCGARVFASRVSAQRCPASLKGPACKRIGHRRPELQSAATEAVELRFVDPSLHSEKHVCGDSWREHFGLVRINKLRHQSLVLPVWQWSRHTVSSETALHAPCYRRGEGKVAGAKTGRRGVGHSLLFARGRPTMKSQAEEQSLERRFPEGCAAPVYPVPSHAIRGCVAFLFTITQFEASAHIVSDCLGVLSCWQHGIQWASSAPQTQGGLWPDVRCAAQA